MFSTVRVVRVSYSVLYIQSTEIHTEYLLPTLLLLRMLNISNAGQEPEYYWMSLK